MHADVALVLHGASGRHIAADVVRIEHVGAHTDRLLHVACAQALVFREHVIAEHSPGLTDVELRRPVAVVAILVLGQAPGLHRRADVCRHTVVVREKPEQAQLIPLVVGDDLPSPLVRRLGVVIVRADVVEAEGAVVVGVGLAVWDGVELPEDFPPAGGERSGEQFVGARIVAGGLRNRHAVVGVVGEAHPEAIGLHAGVAFAAGARRVGGDKRQQATGGIAWLLEWIDRHGPVVLVVQNAHLVAVPLLAVDAVCLASHVILHAGGRHQIAFIRGVDEHLSREPSRRPSRPSERRDRHDLRARTGLASRPQLHPLLAVEQHARDDLDTLLLEPLVEDPLGDMRLEEPHRVVAHVGLVHSLSEPCERLPRLPLPCLGRLVVFPDATIKLPREAADGAGVAAVGVAEAAAGEPAEMRVGRDDHHAGAEHGRTNRSHHRATGAAVNHDVVDWFGD